MKLPIALRLAIRQWLARPLRPVLCSLAIGAAVALIVVVGAALDSLRQTVSGAIGQALGVAEVHIRPAQRGTESRVPDALLQQLRARPEVELASERLASQAVLTKGDDRLWFDVVGISEPLDSKLRPKIFDAGGTLTGKPDEILVDTMIAEKMSLEVGEEITYEIKDLPPRKLRIVGILKRPVIEFVARPTMFVPMDVLIKDLGIPREYSVIDLKLRPPGETVYGAADDIDFDKYAKDLGEQLGDSVEVTPGANSKSNMSEVTRNMRLLLSLLSALAAICASLIIGTTLSVGVQERVRQFGQLRCLGASRGQLAAFLLGDALVMLVIGLALGLALGIAAGWLLVSMFPTFFQTLVLSVPTILIAFGCGAFATFLGALIPIWQVTRVSPMAAVTAVAQRARMSRVLLAGAAGVLCLVLQQLLWRVPGDREVRLLLYIFCGSDLIFIGWCLLAPISIVGLERVASRLVGMLFFVRPSLLRRAWSRTPWRAGAMIAALMIGVTIFTAVRARGQSILNSFPVPQIPDLVIKSRSGLSDKRLALLAKQHPELHDPIPFDYLTARLKAEISPVGKVMGDEQTTFIAVDVRKFADYVALDYEQGDPVTSLREMDEGRHVYVTTEFAAIRKLGKGDRVVFRSADGKDVEFTIAAVVRSTSVEMVKNYFDLRSGFGEKSVSSVLGTIADARQVFKLGDPTLMLINVDAAQRGRMTELRKELETEGMVSLSSVEMKTALQGIIQRIISGLSVVGLGALCLASLGVANMVIASIHARRYEFGVLRAIGAGRMQLIRLVLAEVTLMAIVAGVLGASAGLWYAFMISRVDRVAVGLETSFIHPEFWPAARFAAGLMVVAIGLTTLLGWLAAVVPAVRGARSAQRTLLASGRG